VQGRYLLGVTEPEEARSFLRHECDADLSAADFSERTAQAQRRRGARPPVATLPGPEGVPEDWRPHLEAVVARPLFQRLYGELPWRFAAVPVASLIAVQAHLHFTHALRRAGAQPGTADVLELCLPVQPEALELWGGVTRGDPPSVSLMTRDPNVQITAAKMETQPLRVTFTIGKTALFLQVARLDGRLYLKNGTHRAVGLAAAGVRLLPCVLVDVADVDGLPKLLPFRALRSDHPPLVTDFLDPDLYVEHPWADRVKFIRLVPEMFASALPQPLEV